MGTTEGTHFSLPQFQVHQAQTRQIPKSQLSLKQHFHLLLARAQSNTTHDNPHKHPVDQTQRYRCSAGTRASLQTHKAAPGALLPTPQKNQAALQRSHLPSHILTHPYSTARNALAAPPAPFPSPTRKEPLQQKKRKKKNKKKLTFGRGEQPQHPSFASSLQACPQPPWEEKAMSNLAWL